MVEDLLICFEQERRCDYRGDAYRVRDNGAVQRLERPSARPRPLDGQWTFGRPCVRNGYMHLSSTPVHRIVATAFHGGQPSKSHVVDHIDTNRRNNRPENLRWVTRLENVLLNPITRKRIELAYGSVEVFFAAPDRPQAQSLHPSVDWMRTVSREEAEESRKRLIAWAEHGELGSGGRLGDWIYGAKTEQRMEQDEPASLVQSKTHIALQRDWKTPCEFPNCPDDPAPGALARYRNALGAGATFASNQYGESIVSIAELARDVAALLVLCAAPSFVKDWTLARVTVEDGRFVHQSLGMFFTDAGAQKQLALACGRPWEGGETVDDYY